MNVIQKLIKSFAYLLAFSIIFTLINGLLKVGSLVINPKGYKVNKDSLKSIEIIKESISEIDLKLESASIVFEEGNQLEVLSNGRKVKVTVDGNKLKINQDSKTFSTRKTIDTVKIFLPNMNINTLSIKQDIGNFNIKNVLVDNLNLKLGVGDYRFENIEVLKEGDFKFGVGKVSFLNSKLTLTDIEVGVGKFEFIGTVLEKLELSGGIGKTDITLTDSLDNYKLDVEKGIGKIKLNNEPIKDSIIGNGPNVIEIDAGIGEININDLLKKN